MLTLYEEYLEYGYTITSIGRAYYKDYVYCTDVNGYWYKSTPRSFRKIHRCRIIWDAKNLSIFCEIHGMQYVSHKGTGTHLKLTYIINGTQHTRRRFDIKDGHTPARNYYTDLAVYSKAETLGVVAELQQDLITYVCTGGHHTTVRRTNFMSKSSGMCKKCVAALPTGHGLMYHAGNITECTTLPGLLYMIHLTKGDESFIKVGITKQDVVTRFRHMKDYKYTTLHVYPMYISEAFQLERNILHHFSGDQYTPLIPFGGHTECLSTSEDLLHNYIEQLIKETI